VPSGCGFDVGAGATLRLRPPRRWNRVGIRTTSVLPSSLVSALWLMPPSFRPAALTPHLQRVLLHIDPLDEQLHDPCLLGREQLAPDRGETAEENRNLALGDLVARSLRCCADLNSRV
jgi:hypothetical protein